MRLDVSDLTVVVCNDYCHVQGGASKVAIDEAVALAEAGARVIFLGAVGPVCEALSHERIEVVCLAQPELLNAMRHPMALLQSMLNRPAYLRTRAILAGLEPARTIVHLHGYTKALSSSPMLAARRMGFRTVCTLHDFYAACPNGAFFDFSAQTLCTRRGLSASCMLANCDKRAYAHKMFRVARGLVQRDLARFPASVSDFISLSRKSADILRPYLGADARLHALENIIDVPARAAVAAGSSREWVFVGRLDVEKGVQLLARAAASIGLKVTFIGDGPLRAEIEAVPGMSVTGWLSGAQVKQRLAGARCLVFPSLWYEAYGLVVSEAAALGIPAVVSDISAAAERVVPGETGWQFRSGDQKDLTRCLRETLNDEMVAAAGLRAHAAFWREPPTAAHHATGLLQIYRAILEKVAAPVVRLGSVAELAFPASDRVPG